MPKRKGKLVHFRKLFKKHHGIWRTTLDILAVLSFILTMFTLLVGDRFVLIERIHEKELDLTDAYAHPSASLGFTVSAEVIIQRANGSSTVLHGG